MDNKQSGYRCEKCGGGITLQEYLAVDIMKIAMCKECKEKNNNRKRVNDYMRRTGYAGRNTIR